MSINPGINMQDYRKSQTLVYKKGICLEKSEASKLKPKMVSLSNGSEIITVPAWDAMDKQVFYLPHSTFLFSGPLFSRLL